MDPAAFADSVRADAAGWDRHGGVPVEVVREVARAGFLAADVPARYGGRDFSPAEVGRLCADLGGTCSALRALVTVQGMVAAAVLRWGNADQRARWLPALTSGDRLAGFAATEAGAGSDLAAVGASLDSGRLRGHKRWVTFGALADVFLVLATRDGRPVAVLVEAGPGVVVEPVTGQLGMRAARIAHVRFDDASVAEVLAPPGFGLSHVVGTALDHGRFTVAWGCAGMARACLDLAAGHVATRTQAGTPLSEHQAVRAVLGRCLVEVRAAQRLCAHAAALRERGDPAALHETVLAKYGAARAASVVGEHAVRLHGAAGVDADSAVGRFHRDAAVMRIIEGSDEVAEQHLGRYALRGGA